jgi:hypothetical protein
MIKENIFVAINHKDEIQWVKGSSSKTRYFRTDKYLKSAVEYHNKYHPEDIWKIRKCVIVEDMSHESGEDACKDCCYNDGEVHAECVICDKAESEE